MARIAEDSGGIVVAEDAARRVADHFREHMARARPPRVQRTTAWDRWWVLLGVFAVWMSAWALRRSGGLI
jgi:hypothetical protein